MNFIEYLRRSETDSGRLGYTFGGDPTSPRQGSSEGGFRVPGALIQRDHQLTYATEGVLSVKTAEGTWWCRPIVPCGFRRAWNIPKCIPGR